MSKSDFMFDCLAAVVLLMGLLLGLPLVFEG
jgi:hypothetical protein